MIEKYKLEMIVSQRPNGSCGINKENILFVSCKARWLFIEWQMTVYLHLKYLDNSVINNLSVFH